MQLSEDLLSHFNTATSDLAGKPSMPPYHVPSGLTISRLYPQNLMQKELQDAVQVSFGQKRQVIDTTMCLLSLFTIPSSNRPEVMSNIGPLTSDSWTLNVLIQFWEAIAPEGGQLNYVESTLSSVICFLDRVRVFLTRLKGFDPGSAIINRVSIFCSQITMIFLFTETVPLPSPIEKRLCIMIFDLALTNPTTRIKPHSFIWSTLPNLLEVRQDHKRFDAFGQDLQVRASRCSYWQLLIHKSYRMPYP